MDVPLLYQFLFDGHSGVFQQVCGVGHLTTWPSVGHAERRQEKGDQLPCYVGIQVRNARSRW